MQLSSSIRIDRTIEDVFEYVAEVRNLPRWVSGVSSARLLSPKMGKGARFVADYTSNRRKNVVEFEVSEFEAPNLLALEVARGPFAFRGRLKLIRLNGSTEITNEIEADPDSLSARLASLTLGPLLHTKMKERLQRELMTLEQAITGRTRLA